MLSNKRQKIEHEDNTHLLDIGSTSEDHSSDVEFVITKEMLIENSDSEQETWTNDDAEFTRRIVERYGGNKQGKHKKGMNNKKLVKRGLQPTAQVGCATTALKRTNQKKAVATVDDSPKGTFPGHAFSSLDDAILAQVLQKSKEEAEQIRTNLVADQANMKMAIAASSSEAEGHLANISHHYNRLQQVLSINDLSIKRVFPDGDCLFHSTLIHVQSANPNLSTTDLRRIVSKHMIEYASTYAPFLAPSSSLNFLEAAEQLAIPGRWNLDLADAVPLAICNIFQERMVIYSSNQSQSVITIEPTLAASTLVHHNKTPVLQFAYLALQNCEHYDAVLLPPKVMIDLTIPVLVPQVTSDSQKTTEWYDSDDDEGLIEALNEVEYDGKDEDLPDALNKAVSDRSSNELDSVKSNQEENYDNENKSEKDVKNGNDEKTTNTQESEQKKKRAKTANPSLWERNALKQKRQTGQTYTRKTGTIVPERSVQPHTCSKCRFKCGEIISEEERKVIHTIYWEMGNIERQRDFINANICEEDVITRRKITSDKKQISRKYFLPGKGTSPKVRVCKSFFSKTINVSLGAINTALLKRTESSTTTPDQRGKKEPKNKTPPLASEYVRNHISSFPVVDSHYCRKDSTKQYLDMKLNIKSMYELYRLKAIKDQVKTIVSENVYRDIFHRDFNLSFMHPKKDRCDICCKFEACKESVEKEMYEKHLKNKDLARKQKNEDKERAKMGELHACTFDMEQVLQCPHSNMGQLYYLRKLNVYNCSVYSLGNGDASCFVWSEVEGKRGACEVATSIYQYLKSLPKSVTHVILYSDTCSGQNRNKFMVSMFKYVVNTEQILTIEHKFMEKGHSHMEVDSMHAAIESRKRLATVSVPRDYYMLMRMARTKNPYTVVPIENDNILDFKALEKELLNNTRVDETGAKVSWLLVKAVCVRKGQDAVYIKYSLDEDYTAIPQVSTRKSASNKPVTLKQKYENPLPIPAAKKRDLVSMCKSGIIPKECHQFYLDLSAIPEGQATQLPTDGNMSE